MLFLWKSSQVFTCKLYTALLDSVLKYIYLEKQHCGIVCKAAACNYHNPHDCWFKPWSLHFWHSSLLGHLGKEQKRLHYLGTCMHVGDREGAPSSWIRSSPDLALWPFEEKLDRQFLFTLFQSLCACVWMSFFLSCFSRKSILKLCMHLYGYLFVVFYKRWKYLFSWWICHPLAVFSMFIHLSESQSYRHWNKPTGEF